MKLFIILSICLIAISAVEANPIQQAIWLSINSFGSENNQDQFPVLPPINPPVFPSIHPHPHPHPPKPTGSPGPSSSERPPKPTTSGPSSSERPPRPTGFPTMPPTTPPTTSRYPGWS